MEKVLVLASVASMIKQFNMENIKLLLSLNYEVHVAANFDNPGTISKDDAINLSKTLTNMGIVVHNIPMSRNPISIMNIKSFYRIKKILNENNFCLVHSHSPIGGVLARLAAVPFRKNGLISIYTAHGFHFYKGAPFKNWLIYYPLEKWLSKYTDTLITINQEDYERAKGSFKAKRIEYVPGVGLDIDKFKNVVVDRKTKREEIGIPQDAFVILSVGELNKNKNHEVVIRAIAKLNNPNIHYVICGRGPLENHLNKLANELGIGKNVHLLGFRSDIAEICKSSDVFAFPSLREGLGMAALESMATGLPIITSNVHGINDYSINGVTGFSCSPSDVNGFANAIYKLSQDNKLKEQFKTNNLKAVKRYDKQNAVAEISKIYNGVF